MRNDKSEAFVLRKKGLSYSAISNRLVVPKSTISYWFKDIDWSKDIKKQLSDKAKIISTERLKRLIVLRKIKYDKLYQLAQREAEIYFLKNKNNLLFITGIMLYWGEGDKNFKNGAIRITNTDPTMIKIFKQFLLDIFNYEETKIRAWLLLYPDLNIKECLKYWNANTDIPLINFTKSTIIGRRHKTHRLPYGVCTISITNKYLKKKILTWIDLYKQDF